MRTTDSSSPSSAKRRPSALAWTPRRCSAETAFGERVLDAARRVEDDDAVADARRLLGLDVLGVEREVAAGDHAGEAVEHVDVGALELAGLAAERRRRLAGEHADRPGPGSGPGCTAPAPAPCSGEIVDLALDDLAEPVGPGDERPVLLLEDGAHPVAAVDRLAVVGRTWPSTTNRLPPSSRGSPTTPNSSRSAKQRSASRPQLAASRCRCATDGVSRRVKNRASSARVAIGRESLRVRPRSPPVRAAVRVSARATRPARAGRPGR